MSNKTQLQTNNMNLDALITRVNAAKEVAASLPEAGDSGGGNIETCTLRVLNSDGKYHVQSIAYEGLQDGNLVVKSMYEGSDVTSFDYTVTDALCDGLVIVTGYGDLDTWWQLSNTIGAIWLNHYAVFRITAPANGVATIDLLGSD